MILPVLLMTLAQANSTRAIPAETPVHLGISLALTHAKEMAALQQAQQDPRSAEFRRWITPAEFGERFGQSAQVYGEIVKTLRSGGLEVTTFPNRSFVEARGRAGQIEAMLGAHLVPVEGQPLSVHALEGALHLPLSMASVINISGLDTRVHTRHHLGIGSTLNSMGPQDLRKFYGAAALHARGFVGQGQKTAVLSTALAPGFDVDEVAIRYFFTNIANGSVRFVKRVIPNPQQDYDTQSGGAGEFELDVQMHAVGIPGGDSITLVASPASEVFTTGANDIANNLPGVTAVSISLGICEANGMQAYPGEFTSLRNAVIQGGLEGQTWSAASGDNGANDCRNGTAAVDFPSSIPEMMALGGTSIPNPPWNSNRALTGYTQEVAWNDGAQGGAAGGGISSAYMRPGYQQGLGLIGSGRSVPDISMIAGLPGVAVSSANPPGPLTPAEGTSVSSPLSAGMFALMSSVVGCRFGDIHSTIYALGTAQQDGGAIVFHDVTSGNLTSGGVTGPAAGPGYDSATGWGSIDVSALAAAWPACPTVSPDGGVLDGGPGVPVAPYSACNTIGCDGGCTTLNDGPSTCAASCSLSTGVCPTGTVCSQGTIFSTATRGQCVPGCSSNADCGEFPGTICSLCAHTCIPPGLASARVGDACMADSDCPSGGYCAGGRSFTNGYCTFDCQMNVSPTSACACPAASHCGLIGRNFQSTLCVADCTTIGSACGQTGYICQQQKTGGPACLPACTIRALGGGTFDSCTSINSSLACDVASGICGGPRDAGTPVVDAGIADAGMQFEEVDAGPTTLDPVSLNSVPSDLGALPDGCNCQSVNSPLMLGAALLLLLRRRSR